MNLKKLKRTAYGAMGGMYGAQAGAALDYIHRKDGSSYYASPAQYQAQDEYSQLSQPERDWYMNQEQGGMAQGGPAWSKEQYKLAQAQYKDQLNRTDRVNQINQWEQSRNPYYASLYEAKNQAAQTTNQQQYADAAKRMQLQHAGRGTSGGSQEQYNTATLGAEKALRDSQAAQQNQNYVQGIRRNDQAQAQALRMQQNSNPYTNALAQNMANSANIQGGGYANNAALEQTRMQDEQSYQNNMSQLYGQSINTGIGGLANMYGGGANG
jgi:hypothetical protein